MIIKVYYSVKFLGNTFYRAVKTINKKKKKKNGITAMYNRTLRVSYKNGTSPAARVPSRHRGTCTNCPTNCSRRRRSRRPSKSTCRRCGRRFRLRRRCRRQTAVPQPTGPPAMFRPNRRPPSVQAWRTRNRPEPVRVRKATLGYSDDTSSRHWSYRRTTRRPILCADRGVRGVGRRQEAVRDRRRTRRWKTTFRCPKSLCPCRFSRKTTRRRPWRDRWSRPSSCGPTAVFRVPRDCRKTTRRRRADRGNARRTDVCAASLRRRRCRADGHPCPVSDARWLSRPDGDCFRRAVRRPPKKFPNR